MRPLSRVVVLLSVIASCRGSHGNRPDAGPGGPDDASIDATADAPPDGAVDATVDGGVPVPVVCLPLMAPKIATARPRSTPAVADVNGDGKPDLVFTLAGSGDATPAAGPSLNVMLGNGDGTFQAARPTELDPDPHASTGFPLIADIDGDGHLDAVIGGVGIQLVLGDGQGNFTLGDRFPAPGFTFRLGDLDRDGHVDIALLDSGVTILFGTGGGHFAAPISLDPDTAYQSIAIADIDGDHVSDVVVVGSSLAVFRSRGDRSFDPPFKTELTGNAGHDVAVGDLNADGIADIVTSGLTSSTGTAIVETWLRNGTGGFVRQGFAQFGADHRTDLPPQAFTPVLALGDFDHDTKLDVAVTYFNRDVIFLVPGDGAGNLRRSAVHELATRLDSFRIISADLDGDGRVDLLTVGGVIEIMMATPDGTFRAPYSVRILPDFIDHHGITELFASGDVDGDGQLDFADGSRDIDEQRDVGGILVARSTGSLDGYALNPNAESAGEQQVVFRDIDGDGDLDMIASRGQNVSVFFNPGNGPFGPRIDYPSTILMSGFPTFVSSFALGDLDGDHRPEIVVSDRLSNVEWVIRVQKNDGSGTFSDLPVFPGEPLVLVQDFNGDGRDDLVTWGLSTMLHVRLSNGDGTFGSSNEVDIGARIGVVVTGDFDGDGVPDLAAETAAHIVLLHGKGDGNFTNAGTAEEPPGGLIAVANIDNVPPLDIVGHHGIIYRAGDDSRTDTWAMYATEVRDANGDSHPDVLGVGFHGFEPPQTHAVFALTNQCH